MKTIKYLFILALSSTVFMSCSSDDTPTIVNEEEIITTVRLTLNDTNGNMVTLQSQDLDGDGPDAPVNTITGTILASTQYTGSVQFLNELENPADNITTEVLEEDEEHQVFYTFTGTSGSTITYADTDGNGNPIGVSVIFNSGVVSTGNTLTITLIHEPVKDASGVSDGNSANAGGETDAEVTFTFDIN